MSATWGQALRTAMRAACAAAALLGMAAPSANSAELRIEFKELAALAGAFLNSATVRLHNVPGGVLDFTAGSTLTIAGVARPIPVPVRSFEMAGGRYAYMMNDINASGIAVAATAGAVRLSLSFEGDGPELVGQCLSGFCPPDAALPEIEWLDAGVIVDLVPVRVASSLALQAKRVEISGRIEPRCRGGGGLIATSLCRAVLPKARQTIAKLRGDLNSGLMAQVNSPPVQEKIAAELKGYLARGPAGDIGIARVALDGEGRAVIVSFCLACAP
ncbi:MAG: hypothetical protein ACRCS9_07460 [Hyphomicrobium sp.]